MTQPRNRAAFSLVEILIASSILVGCMLPVITLSQRALSETESGQEDLLARHLVIDMCERFKTVPLAELAAAAADPASLERDELLLPLAWRAGSQEKHLAGDVLRLQRTVSIVQMQPGLHRVTFAVTWMTRRRQARTVSLTRLVHAH